jgi:hypothetical protein
MNDAFDLMLWISIGIAAALLTMFGFVLHNGVLEGFPIKLIID